LDDCFYPSSCSKLETLLGIEAVDKLDPDKNESNTNKELLAQGIGNIACGFVGALTCYILLLLEVRQILIQELNQKYQPLFMHHCF
jgi:hypothetical protein